jgi:signal recognition particle receptor subunit alpha
VDNIKTLFVDLYGDQLKKPHTTIVECHFDEYFDQQMRELEKAGLNKDTRPAEPNSFLEAASSGLSDDEPPPLPGLLSRSEFPGYGG